MERTAGIHALQPPVGWIGQYQGEWRDHSRMQSGRDKDLRDALCRDYKGQGREEGRLPT